MHVRKTTEFDFVIKWNPKTHLQTTLGGLKTIGHSLLSGDKPLSNESVSRFLRLFELNLTEL